MLGALRSILLPPTGPAWLQFAAASQTLREFVGAFVVSVPALTLVVGEKFASAALARPEPVSLARQPMERLSPCHEESALLHETCGVFVSILTVRAWFGSAFPALSTAW